MKRFQALLSVKKAMQTVFGDMKRLSTINFYVSIRWKNECNILSSVFGEKTLSLSLTHTHTYIYIYIYIYNIYIYIYIERERERERVKKILFCVFKMFKFQLYTISMYKLNRLFCRDVKINKTIWINRLIHECIRWKNKYWTIFPSSVSILPILQPV